MKQKTPDFAKIFTAFTGIPVVDVTPSKPKKTPRKIDTCTEYGEVVVGKISKASKII